MQGQGAQGQASPQSGMSQVNVYYKTSFTQMKPGTEYEIICASAGKAKSDVLKLSTQGNKALLI